MDSTRLRVEISKGSVEPVSCGVIRSTATGAKAWHQILHMFNMPTSRVRRPSKYEPSNSLLCTALGAVVYW
jgi:hypothetical protein